SISFCHYNNPKTVRKLISLEDLKNGIIFAMKQNLMIQFVFPDYDLPIEYKITIESIDNKKIVSDHSLEKNADVFVFNDLKNLLNFDFSENNEKVIVFRTSKIIFFENYKKIIPILKKVIRLNIVFTDIENFADTDIGLYKKILNDFKIAIIENCENSRFPQLNLLTDRVLLDKMNNCNAGNENITLAPNGKFFICPAFYYENEDDCVGSLKSGLEIKNIHLYKTDFAPICRNCDAYQCKRCIWLNRKTTHEVNTPSHEQCLISHLERNGSEELLREFHLYDAFLDKEIKSINYLDPYEILINKSDRI
ncbi:MAG TPA: CXXX repeat peptide maturase, partial [Bacteroidales bacterium]|nr:CXXX repeat peptide maturase [Bacteroidales bacterium]